MPTILTRDGRLRRVLPTNRSVGWVTDAQQRMTTADLAARILQFERAIEAGTATPAELATFIKAHATKGQVRALLDTILLILANEQSGSLRSTVFGFIGGAISALVVDQAITFGLIPGLSPTTPGNKDSLHGLVHLLVTAAAGGLGYWAGMELAAPRTKETSREVRAGLVLMRRIPEQLWE